jgi:Mor family transcriptional regulator
VSAPGVPLLDPAIFKYLDVFKCIMLREHDSTLLPDLAEALGLESLPKFLTLFAGVTFKVPGRKVLENAARDAAIFSEMKGNVDPEVVAVRHGVTTSEALAINTRVRRIMEEVLGG